MRDSKWISLAHHVGVLLLGWWIPGGAHWVLKRRFQGITIFFTIHFMFLYGLFMGSPVHRYKPQAPVRSLLETIAQMGNGGAYWLARWMLPRMEQWPDSWLRRYAERSDFGRGDAIHAWAEKGYTFALSSGLLNLLLLMKVYDMLKYSESESLTPMETSSDVA